MTMHSFRSIAYICDALHDLVLFKNCTMYNLKSSKKSCGWVLLLVKLLAVQIVSNQAKRLTCRGASDWPSDHSVP